jgi:hypothetical protein
MFSLVLQKKIRIKLINSIPCIYHSYIAGLKRELLKMYPALEANKDGTDNPVNDNQVIHIYYKVRSSM